jgi:hypothetical protein
VNYGAYRNANRSTIARTKPPLRQDGSHNHADFHQREMIPNAEMAADAECQEGVTGRLLDIVLPTVRIETKWVGKKGRSTVNGIRTKKDFGVGRDHHLTEIYHANRLVHRHPVRREYPETLVNNTAHILKTQPKM